MGRVSYFLGLAMKAKYVIFWKVLRRQEKGSKTNTGRESESKPSNLKSSNNNEMKSERMAIKRGDRIIDSVRFEDE